MLHILQSVGELKFAFIFDIIIQQILHFAAQVVAVAEIVNSDNGHIADEGVGFFYKIADKSGFVEFYNSIGAGVIYALHNDAAFVGEVEMKGSTE